MLNSYLNIGEVLMPQNENGIEISDNNRVTIRVWQSNFVPQIFATQVSTMSKLSLYFSGLKNQTTLQQKTNNLPETRIGHATLQTYVGGKDGKGIYASFWPVGRDDKETGRTRLTRLGVTGFLVPNLEMDKDLEGDVKRDENDNIISGKPCEPDITVDLYSLDVQEINKEFEKFEKSNGNWSIWGSAFFRERKTRNCSGLCSYLLRQGGINNLFGKDYILKGAKIGAQAGAIGGALAGSVAIPLGVITGPGVVVVAAAGLAAGLASGGAVTGGILGATVGAAMSHSGIPDQLLVTPSDIGKIALFTLEAERKKYFMKNEPTFLNKAAPRPG